ncbi:tripartite tricarboxylate transporter substrate-binding protein [Paracraurococcus ruber]|nr:tripartite tricarboxylate transporter substrate-binding protein [Paracraurococcus ruber]TDG28696.1 tripartite tricarboxylate transporter substrate binding protein [Paracraurococcus ruber]
MLRRRHLLALPLLPRTAAAQGQAWSPDRPIRFLQGFAPGGTTDILARLLAPELAAALGQRVVVENCPGAGGTLAAEALARARPDGATMMLLNNGFAVAAALFRRLPYDPEADIDPCALVATAPLVLLAAPRDGIGTLPDLLAAARARPGALTVATVGIGSTQHFALEALAALAGIGVTHVPYRGTPAALVALRTGEVQAVMETLGAVLGQVQAGEARALAVTAAARAPLLPDVPTMAESGIAGFDLATWYAIGFPAGTPAAVQARLAEETARAVAAPRLRAQFDSLGLQPASGGPEATRALIRAEIARALQARASIPQP